MVYPSLPAYLDPPNWNQQQQQQQTSNQVGGVSGDGHQSLLPPLPSRPGQDGTNVPGSARLGPEGSNAAGAGRPGSMTERARVAKVPQSDQVLKCPRCDSTNTKFCYFNNYSLSQPRHFCKTCRRYWTRGGALRNVPVGGGCRRNKRSKSGASGGSKSSTSSTNHVGGTSTIITTSSSSAIGIGVGSVTSHGNQLPPHIPFLASSSLHPLSEYVQTTIGLNYGVIPNVQNPVLDHQYHVGGGSSNMGLEQWRLQQLQQQIPFFAELEQQQQQQHQQHTPALGLFSFDGDVNVVDGGTTFSGQQAHGKATAAGLITQLASVKMEENEQQRLNLSRQYLGLNSNIIGNDGQYWGAGAGGGGGGSTSGGVDIGWSDLSGFNSSSTGNLL